MEISRDRMALGELTSPSDSSTKEAELPEALLFTRKGGEGCVQQHIQSEVIGRSH